MSDRTIFSASGVIFSAAAGGLILMKSLGFIEGDLSGALFLMGAGILASVWALEERVKEIEKEMKRQ